MEELLTAEEVAKFLKVSPSAVFKWARQGIIPSYRIHEKSLRFKKSDIEDFVERGKRIRSIHKNGGIPVKMVSSSH